MEYTQRELENIGNYGCYFISIMFSIGETKINRLLEVYRKAVRLGFMDKDCYIINPELLVGLICGHTYRVTKTETKPNLDSKKDFLIGEFYNPRTGKAHFCAVTDGVYDPLGDSVTVKEGFIRSYRYFKFIK